MIIRPHRRSDGDRIAEILAAGWKFAYSGFLPAEMLAPRVDPAFRRTEIANWLDREFDPLSEAIFVAEHAGMVSGFIHVEFGDKGDLGATGVVNLLYVEPAMHGRGAGRVLMAAGARWLVERRPGPLALSAFAENRSRSFYNRLGGLEAKTLRRDVEGGSVETVLYLWPRPEVLFDDAAPHIDHRPR